MDSFYYLFKRKFGEKIAELKGYIRLVVQIKSFILNNSYSQK